MEFLYLVISIPHAEGHRLVSLAHLSSKKDVLRTKFAIFPPPPRKIDHIKLSTAWSFTFSKVLCILCVCVCVCLSTEQIQG